ncbi:hypothetical protein OROMI_033861 [Orobanche minor]
MASEENREPIPKAGNRADGGDCCDSEKNSDDESLAKRRRSSGSGPN